MSSFLLYSLPFLCALLGWLVARFSVVVYLSFVLKKKTQIGAAIGNYAEQQVSFGAIEQQLTAPETIEKILPFAEEHIDTFLRVKLPAAMPMLAMFISDKLVAEMKGIFMKELQQLFPALIGQYLGNLKNDINISHFISSKVDAISNATLRSFLWKQLRVIEIACALTGLLCGILYIFLTRIA